MRSSTFFLSSSTKITANKNVTKLSAANTGPNNKAIRRLLNLTSLLSSIPDFNASLIYFLILVYYLLKASKKNKPKNRKSYSSYYEWTASIAKQMTKKNIESRG